MGKQTTQAMKKGPLAHARQVGIRKTTKLIKSKQLTQFCLGLGLLRAAQEMLSFPSRAPC